MKKSIGFMVGAAVTAALAVVGCNWDEGACYAPNQGGGQGGGPIIPGPTGGNGDTDPDPQGAGDGTEVPCGTSELYACTIHYVSHPGCANGGPCDGPYSGVFDSVASANQHCKDYAASQGGTCNNDCKVPPTSAKDRMWECSGDATCKASGKADTSCEFTKELVLASSKSAAAKILVGDCETLKPGYSCKNSSEKPITCFDPNAN